MSSWGGFAVLAQNLNLGKESTLLVGIYDQKSRLELAKAWTDLSGIGLIGCGLNLEKIQAGEDLVSFGLNLEVLLFLRLERKITLLS